MHPKHVGAAPSRCSADISQCFATEALSRDRTDARRLPRETGPARRSGERSHRPSLFLSPSLLIDCLLPASAQQRLQLSAQNDIPDATKYICKTRAANKIKPLAQRPAVTSSRREITGAYYFIKSVSARKPVMASPGRGVVC